MQVQGTNSRSTDLLNYAKLILSKVSFDANLFRMEIKKFVRDLDRGDCLALRDWCRENYGKLYGSILTEEFAEFSI